MKDGLERKELSKYRIRKADFGYWVEHENGPEKWDKVEHFDFLRNARRNVTQLEQKTSFLVLKKPCDECLFSEAKIVDDDRRDEIIADCLKNDLFFICIKTENVCCNGFYRAHKLDIWPIRLAIAFDGVKFIDPSDEVRRYNA